MKVLIVAPVPPPYGGMALQAQQLERLLQADGLEAALFPSNFALPRAIELVPGLRTLLRFGLIWPRLWRAVRGIDVLHVLAASWVYFFVVVYPAVVIGRLRGRRIVLNYRGGEARVFFSKYRRLVAPVFRLASIVTAPSEFLAAVIRERFAVDVHIVPNVLDTSLFSYRRRDQIRPRMLVTRHLEPMYDVESVLKAFREVQREFPEASLSIAGAGSEQARLRRLVSEWRLDNVRFFGAVPHRELPAIYDDCDIYVNASRVDNFPGALLEASAAGLAVVSTRAGGIPFIYDDGRTARLVDPGDWMSLGRAVVDALRFPAETRQITVAAAAMVKGCEWNAVRPRLFDVYGVPATFARPASEGVECVAG
jgi:glycosyltransferase involved in cell wall biosynthesis